MASVPVLHRLAIMSKDGEYVIRNNPNGEGQEEEQKDLKYSLGGTLIQWKVSDNE